MKRHNVILESNVEPKDKNVLWLHGKKLKKFGNTGWEDIGNEALALGALYGYFPDSSSLPTDATTPGYAYVGLGNPYKIWKFNGESWSDSGTSIDMNDADEEDITRNTDGKLQFKNRAYGDGMGYVILRKDKTITEQVTQANTIYEIRYKFDLDGSEVTVPTDCVLKFVGGKISNGSLIGDRTQFDCLCYEFVLDNVSINGTVSFAHGLTPNNVGAIGDGISDDTTYLQKWAVIGSSTGCILSIPNGGIYYITDSICNNSVVSLFVNIVGALPTITTSLYQPSNFGGILVGDNVSVFKDCEIHGSIKNVGIYGKKRDGNIVVFDNCKASHFELSYCNISQVEAIFQDTSLGGVSRVCYNKILTAYYFSKFKEKGTNLTDTFIIGNWINGGAERNDNACFQWHNYNGTIISNNFIDYYRTIFEPTSDHTVVAGVINSCNNQYQVFRYFYRTTENVKQICLASEKDHFNWTDESKLQKLRDFIPLKYTVYNVEYDIPSYVGRIRATDTIYIKNASFEANVGNLIYGESSLTLYDYNRFEFDAEFIGNDARLITYKEGNWCYNAGNYRQNEVKITGTIDNVDNLPAFGSGWTKTHNGMMFKKGELIYKATNLYDNTSKAWVQKYVVMNKTENTKGTYDNRPMNTEVGFAYYCTDKALEGSDNNGIMIFHIGNDVWIDALGGIIDSQIQYLEFATGKTGQIFETFKNPYTIKAGESIYVTYISGATSAILQGYINGETNYKSAQFLWPDGSSSVLTYTNDTEQDVVITKFGLYNCSSITEPIRVKASKKNLS